MSYFVRRKVVTDDGFFNHLECGHRLIRKRTGTMTRYCPFCTRQEIAESSERQQPGEEARA